MTGIDRPTLAIWLLALLWCATVGVMLVLVAWWLVGLGG